MRQIVQDLGHGLPVLAEVPRPQASSGRVLIETRASLLSSGTERMLVDFGRAGWVEKARQQPERVVEVLQKVRTDGLLQTLDAVRSKLEQPIPLGYSSVGVVREIGEGVVDLEPGDRVVSNGPHAELVAVPRNLCARVPDSVTEDDAAFTVLGSISLQAVRLVAPTLGESIAVVGLGMLGLLAVQLLRAHGCRVLGIDLDPARLALAERFGAQTVLGADGRDIAAAAERVSRGRGMDGVIIAAATKSNEVVSQAAQMCRKRARVVLLGVVGLDLKRADFYEKELTFQVSCSYGPGRYDARYEADGIDYPVGFVRWTSARNFEAVLDSLAEGALDVSPLVTHRFPFEEAPLAYEVLIEDPNALGILLQYDKAAIDDRPTVELRGAPADDTRRSRPTARPVVGVIGAGNYSARVLIPALAGQAELAFLANQGGVAAAKLARKYGFARLTTDVESVLTDPAVDAVVIATRHDSHAALVARALREGKHVFCEKPLATSLEGLDLVSAAWSATPPEARPILMVGFNRRFSPLTQVAKELLASSSGPKTFSMMVNAGALPREHWAHDPLLGGGRIIGEACHFIDLLRYLADAPLSGWDGSRMRSSTEDTASLQLEFEDGSIGTVHYWANGSKAFPKERLEVFAGGRILQLDNFRRLRTFGWGRSKSLLRQDKGQRQCASAFIDAVRRGTVSPTPFDELIEVTRVAIELA